LSSTTSPKWRAWSGGPVGPGHQREELVADVDEGRTGRPAAQGEFEELPVEGERLVDVADFERDVVDPDQTCLHRTRVGVTFGDVPDDRELDRRPAAFDEVSEYARDQNENEQRQKPGPPAVSCEQHINLRCGLGPSRSGQ
jgi:hypothetical protein